MAKHTSYFLTQSTHTLLYPFYKEWERLVSIFIFLSSFVLMKQQVHYTLFSYALQLVCENSPETKEEAQNVTGEKMYSV